MHDKLEKNKKPITTLLYRTRYVLILCTLWCGFMVFLYRSVSSVNSEHVDEQLLTQARTLYTFVVDTRNWNAKHGGVYVKESEFGIPNEWLPVDGRAVDMPDGSRFVLINPAYMSRQLSENSNLDGAHFKITSVKPLRPENVADNWETAAFESNANGMPEVYSYENHDHSIYFRYLKPLYALSSCLKCHVGIKEGNVLGGISISLDAQDILGNVRQQNNSLFWAYGFMGLVGTAGIVGVNVLQRRKEQLKQDKEKMKDAFVANMSHDMRTPLAGILGMTQLLNNNKNMDDEQRKKIVEYLNVASASLLEMVSDITDYEALNADKIPIKEVNFLLSHELENCCAMFTPQCVAKGISMRLNIAPNVPKYIVGDAFRIRQVLGNIINNAVKFTDQGYVHIDVSFQNSDLIFEISDSGCGIAKEDQEHIFTRFERGQAITQTDKPGTGLGLAIASEVLRLMNGNISVNSTVGKGTCFTITLPVRIGKEQATPPHYKSNFMEQLCINAHALIVEDNVITAYFVRTVLENIGCKVQVYSSGEQALAYLEHHAIDIIFLDMRMAGIDGLTTAMHIRKIVKFQKTPIILMSASILDIEKHKLVELHIEKTLLKPVSAQDIISLMLEHVPQKCLTKDIGEVKSSKVNVVDKPHKLLFNNKQALETFDNDYVLLNKLLKVWLDDYDTQHEALSLAIKKNDVPQIIIIAHNIKNSAGTLSMEYLKNVADIVESSLSNGDKVNEEQLITVYTETYNHIKERTQI